MKTQMKYIALLGIMLFLSAFMDKTKESKKETMVNFGFLKAAFKAPNGKAYFFTDKKYYRHNLTTDKLDKTATIYGNFKGLVNGIDAAILHNNGKVYFFKGSSYYRYNWSTSEVEKKGTLGVDGWMGVPKSIDAAVLHSNGKVYFFKGNKYYRYSSSTEKVDKVGTIGVDGWKGAPSNIDGALRHTNGKVYFFKDNQYYRYSTTARKVDKIGTIGVDGYKGLSFSRIQKNSVASSANSIRLKVTLTRIKSIQARDRDNIADFILEQKVFYRSEGNQALVIDKNVKVGEFIVNTDAKTSSIIKVFQTHVREGDEQHFINNSLVYQITPQQIKDKRAEFKFYTNLGENDGSKDSWLTKNVFKLYAEGGLDIKKIAFNHQIDVNIYEVLDYLQNPKAAKYGKSYFNGGKNRDMHEYGAYGDVMWMKKGSNNSLIGHLEFGNNNKETYVRLYYRFELMP